MADSNKKIKHSQMHTTTIIRGDSGSIGSDVVALVIRNNKTILNVSNFAWLTYLKLIGTKVETIETCDQLNALCIRTNNKITHLQQLTQLEEVECVDCNQLVYMDLQQATKVQVESCESLAVVTLPKCVSLTLKHCRMLSYLSLGTHLKQLVIDNIDSVATLRLPRNVRLDRLEIANCSNLTLPNDELVEANTIIIRSCPAMSTLEMPISCIRMSIDNCINLLSMENFTANKCLITRCPQLDSIHAFSIGELHIEYCVALLELYTNGACKVVVERCEAVRRIYMANITTDLCVKDCRMLKYINTNRITHGTIRDQSITITGYNSITNLSKLFVTNLSVEDNHNIVSISTIQDLRTLKVINCSALETIHNSVVMHRINVRDCSQLTTISDILSPVEIILSNLPQLNITRFMFSVPKVLMIEQCPNLITQFNGSRLQELFLVCTNIIIIERIHERANVQARNSAYLKDTSSTIQFIRSNKQRLLAVGTITRTIRCYQARTLSKRLWDALKDQNCPICQETVLEPVRCRKARIYSRRFKDDELDAQDEKFKNDELKEQIDPNQQNTADEYALRFVTKCFHTFHAPCLFTWTDIDNSCPLCKVRPLY